ncbi:MAG: isochorismate synthase [Firmicutes bacterium]|nr:isochorismate synthase [Bacillota bacterium]
MDKYGLELTRTWFDDMVREALRHAKERGAFFWLSDALTVPPLGLTHALALARDFGWLFWRPDGTAQLGLGVSREWQWDDPSHLGRMAQRARRLQDEGMPEDAWIVGGQAFHQASPWKEWPTVYLALPLIQIAQDAEKATIRLALRVQPDDTPEVYHRLLEPWWAVLFSSPSGATAMPQPDRITAVPSRGEWVGLVREAAYQIQQGRLEKVVLARSLNLTYHHRLPLPLVLDNLRHQNPDATVFAIKRGDSLFLGASPELLVKVQDRRLETMSLAGSAARGVTPEDDSRLARAMLNDPKTQREHRVVKEHVTHALQSLAHAVTVPPQPTLKKLPSVQHLLTPIEAQLTSDADIWQAVAQLHPTPAVAGYPIPEAIRYLGRAEPFSRGWYAGSLGWTSLAGNGEWIVALRSGRVDPGQTTLYAGCGIMADSDPEAELIESDWKLNTMLSALEVEGDKS